MALSKDMEKGRRLDGNDSAFESTSVYFVVKLFPYSTKVTTISGICSSFLSSSEEVSDEVS